MKREIFEFTHDGISIFVPVVPTYFEGEPYYGKSETDKIEFEVVKYFPNWYDRRKSA